MKKAERVEALEIAKSYDIEVINTWWSPFQNVQWKVLKSRKKLSTEQYGFLSRNKFLKEKETITEGEKSVLTISELGINKLNILKGIS